MANPEHLAILNRGIKAWNQWREENSAVEPDLSEINFFCADFSYADFARANFNNANLSSADLSNANLYAANLKHVNLSKTNFNWTNLSWAELRGANLSEAKLVSTNLNTADLSDADISNARLNAADLSDTILREANLSNSRVGFTRFGGIDLSTAKGLETIIHDAPSMISIDTLFASNGKIPDSFLRGAGVPEIMIEYLPSLLSIGIEFYSLFISYSTADEEFAKRLHADLQAKGVRCWFAPHDMRSGKKVHKQIDEAIRTYDRLLLILSSNSIKSSWVETEISKARKREVSDKKQVLYPLSLCSFPELRDWECFDSDSGKDSAREIREYFIPDFSNWKDHDSYRKAFDELMKDLNKKADPS